MKYSPTLTLLKTNQHNPHQFSTRNLTCIENRCGAHINSHYKNQRGLQQITMTHNNRTTQLQRLDLAPCPGRFPGIIGREILVVSKSNRLHVDNFRLFFLQSFNKAYTLESPKSMGNCPQVLNFICNQLPVLRVHSQGQRIISRETERERALNGIDFSMLQCLYLECILPLRVNMRDIELI